MIQIMVGMIALIYTLTFLNKPNKASGALWLPDKLTNLPKYEFECWALKLRNCKTRTGYTSFVS